MMVQKRYSKWIFVDRMETIIRIERSLPYTYADKIDSYIWPLHDESAWVLSCTRRVSINRPGDKLTKFLQLLHGLCLLDRSFGRIFIIQDHVDTVYATRPHAME